MQTRRKNYKKGVKGPVVAAGDPPVGHQHVAAWEAQGLSSTPTMEESEEFEEPETAPSGADSGGAAATAVGLLPNSTVKFNTYRNLQRPLVCVVVTC